jgi:Na+/proline symporter
MAATTVNDFYAKLHRPGADERTLMRVSRLWTVIWGVVQIAIAIAARGCSDRCSTPGSPYCHASGAVLGAFLLGTLAESITESQTFAGMLAGLVVMTIVWGWTAIAFTWAIFIGAATTVAVAW